MYQQPQQQYHHVEKRGANHGLHIILTILTCGLWMVTGWPIAAMMGRKTKTTTYAPPTPPMIQQQYPPQQHPQTGYQQPYQAQPPSPYYPPQNGPYGQQ